jgi:hypothetical protein
MSIPLIGCLLAFLDFFPLRPSLLSHFQLVLPDLSRLPPPQPLSPPVSLTGFSNGIYIYQRCIGPNSCDPRFHLRTLNIQPPHSRPLKLDPSCLTSHPQLRLAPGFVPTRCRLQFNLWVDFFLHPISLHPILRMWNVRLVMQLSP